MSHSRNFSVILCVPEENHEGSAVIHCMVYKALSVHLSFEFPFILMYCNKREHAQENART